MHGFRVRGGLAAGMLAGLLAVSATSAYAGEAPKPAAKAGEAAKKDDPLESLNRFTSGFNKVFRDVIVDPLVDGYQAVTPEPVQEAIGNAAANLNEPVSAVFSFLQGDTENASNASKRFLINSTLGVGGLNDKATEMGIEAREEDFRPSRSRQRDGSRRAYCVANFGPFEYAGCGRRYYHRHSFASAAGR